MIILAIETSGGKGSVALTTTDRVISEFSVNSGLTHSQTLMPMIEQMLKISGIAKEDLGVLACSSGPGSFTGLRIGAALAKGLAFALNLKIVPVSSLEALAYNIISSSGVAIPIMDARRNQVYAAAYTDSLCILEPATYEIDYVLNFATKQGKEATFLGDGTFVHAKAICEAGFSIASPTLLLQSAASVAMLAARNFDRAISSEEFELIYLRPSQAERELKNG
ncbi:MAG: tRNA (adenosine(37)-N6)-threonylcarbamoyltransferase complex dimerization subunit type 1 TsaB [Clostridiales bacterium]|jgi:tRNA threonylcarbamoyladenosine biosynthesis protein TsaB|nr:tRNA (adenosine(37)-N6)-threonylcarbamoyltransferase complex dimerization subunit type 1 TsaB [Clostridiales bacterium]